MTPTQRKAMEQALADMVSFESGTCGLYRGEFTESITALRAALAEQPAEQEPAIYPDEAFDMGLEAIPYYTTPQPAKRVPLTDDEIEEINVSLTGRRDLARLFARAIERAHGITGEPA